MKLRMRGHPPVSTAISRRAFDAASPQPVFSTDPEVDMSDQPHLLVDEKEGIR
jgi:hypothetical protein